MTTSSSRDEDFTYQLALLTMSDLIDEMTYPGKPGLEWIDSYQRADGTVVDGHLRADANSTIADNLGTDIDGDGIPGYLDSDADGDHYGESLDLNHDGVADMIDVDGDGVADLFSQHLF